jgi:hypothetical protein
VTFAAVWLALTRILRPRPVALDQAAAAARLDQACRRGHAERIEPR